VGLIRDATIDDAAACAAIYAPYVTDTAITFEYEPPSPEEMARRMAVASSSHAWVVHEDAGRVTGYAYAGPYKDRAAYRWTCEVSVYTERGRRRTGAGRALYAGLFERLVARGYHLALAGVTLPNEASEGLHRAMGFELVGVHAEIGWKLDRWHDVARMQKRLVAAEGPPADPR
jgi:L-amino acid N-acyltransferase YncA